MVGGHIVEDGRVVWFLVDVVDDIVGHLLVVDNLCMKFALIAGNSTIKIHKILGESASFVKTCKLDDTTGDNFILLNTKDIFFL